MCVYIYIRVKDTTKGPPNLVGLVLDNAGRQRRHRRNEANYKVALGKAY